jgi:hypothetical protein
MMAGMSLAEWAEALASGEIELDEKLAKRGFDSSYGLTLVADWHPSKNGDLTPQTVSAGTSKNVWWKHSDSSCVAPGGHEWEATGGNRVNRGSGCPACAGKAVVAGVNDMATTHLELTADWHPTKNGDLTPQTVSAGTNKKVWWKHSDSSCIVPGGHEWQTTGATRAFQGSGCPACSGHAVVAGVNDMATTHPELAADWHPTKNGDLTPQTVSAGTHKKVWWRHADSSCVAPGGHEWEAKGSSRVSKGSGCPACAGKAVVAGVNDMATTHPELAADWHPSKNDGLTPQTVMAGTGKKVWWKHSDSSCIVPGGHEWQTTGDSRAVAGSGCPACSGNAVVAGANDMATTHPELAADWHPSKNGDLTPQAVGAGSNKKVWWKHADSACLFPGGYEWESAPTSRSHGGSGCPVCAGNGKAIVAGFNDLATTDPELAAEWHPTKNGDLTPQTVLAGTNKKVWWKHSDPSCVAPRGYEWETAVAARAKLGSGCPACAGQAVVEGVNDMATTHPELAADWHPTKNGDLTPQDVMAGTDKKIWWKHSDPKCVVPGGHEWQVTGSGRSSSGSGCPACNKGWGLDAVRKFIITMIEYGHIGSLSQAELYTLAQQNGLLNSRRVGEAILSLASGDSITKFAGDQLKTISEEADMNVHDLTNDMSDLDIAQANPEAFADFVLAGVGGATFDDPETDDDTLLDTADMAAVMNGDAQVSPELSAAVLPGEAVEQALRSADVLFATVDEQMVDYFIAARKHELWKQAYKDPEAALAAAEAFRG